MQLATDNLSTLNDTVALAESTVNRWLRHETDTADLDIDRLNTAVHALWRLTAIRKTLPKLIPYEQLNLDSIDVSSLADSASLAESLYNGWMRRQSTADPADIDIDCINASIHALARLASIRKTLPEIKGMNVCRTFNEIGDRAKLARQVSDLARDIERRAKEQFDAAHPQHPRYPEDDTDVPLYLSIYRDNGLSDEDYDEDLRKIANDDEDDEPNDADKQSDFNKQLNRIKKLSACVEARRASISRCPRFHSPLAQTLHRTIGMIAKLPAALSPSSQPELPESGPPNSPPHHSHSSHSSHPTHHQPTPHSNQSAISPSPP